MSDTCYSSQCCDKDPMDTDSRNATDADGATAGPANPNCPDGYVWGGLACVPLTSPQACSTGYRWNGEECIPDDSDFECAEGYHDLGGAYSGVCVECDELPAPTVTFLSATSVSFTMTIPENAIAATAYLLENEQGPHFLTALLSPAPGVVTRTPSYILVEGAEYCFYYVVLTEDCGELTSPRTCAIFTSGLLP